MGKYEGWTQEKKWSEYKELRQHLLDEIIAEESIKEVEPVTLSDSLELARETRKLDSGIKTNFPVMDEALMGLRRGSLYVVGGYTGVGKSLFTQNITLNAALDSKKVLMVTTEMPAYSVAEKLRQIWNSYLGDDENFYELPIVLVDNNQNISTEMIESIIQRNSEREEIEGKYNLILIDNLQWFSRGGINMAESIGLATKKLKQLAIKYDVPIILVSHLNREVTKAEKPDMNNLKGSSYIEQDADAVIMVHRDIDGEKYRKDCLLVSIRKNRLTGDLGSFSLITDQNLKLTTVSLEDAKIYI